MPPRVACCLLNWNGKQDTLECLQALQSCDYPCLTIYVADNGSTDGSVQAIRQSGAASEVIETGSNLGFAKGNNILLRKALNEKFDYVWLLNNDTVPRPDTLTHLVRKAEGNPRIGATGSVCLYADRPDTVQVWAGAYVNRWIGFARNTTTPKPDEWFDSIYGASMLVRCEALRQVGLLDGGFFFSWEETDLCLRMVDAGWSLAAASESKLLHKHAGSTGVGNPVLDRFTTGSTLRAIRLYSPLPRVSSLLYAIFRLLKRAGRGDTARLRQVWAGIQDYYRSLSTEESPILVRQQRAARQA